MFAPLAVRAQLAARAHSDWVGRIQTKLAVGAVDDPLEAEADRMAEQVVHGSASDRSGTIGQHATATGHAGMSGSSSEALRAGGRPLEPSLRAFFEPRFGFDFSRVRIHSDRDAALSAQSLSARAYTAGPDVVFGGGQYRPGSDNGRRLLAHELAHVVQQGHAVAMGNGAVRVAPGRTAPMIQRDTPSGATISGGSITKHYDPLNASREEVVQALTDYLNQEWVSQGGRQLKVNQRVRTAVLKLFQEQAVMSATIEQDLLKIGMAVAPADFAAKVGARLPDFISRPHMKHLYTHPVNDPGPHSTARDVKDAVNEKLGQMGKPPKDEGAPNGPVESPSTTPTMGSNPGQHDISMPPQKFGDTTHRVPKSSLPQAPLASDQDAVNKIVQSLDDDALVPDALKGNPDAPDFRGAKLLAQDVANRLAAAQAKKQGTVHVIIDMNYRNEDMGQILDKVESIVRRIAAVVPGGVKNVDEVVISRAPSGSRKFDSWQRSVKLHGGR